MALHTRLAVDYNRNTYCCKFFVFFDKIPLEKAAFSILRRALRFFYGGFYLFLFLLSMI